MIYELPPKPDFWPSLSYEPIKRNDGAWLCPSCARSYGPSMPSCAPCNAKIDAREKRTP